MKKVMLTLAVLLGLVSFGVSQTKDNVARECVLFELFTGVRCPYCPAAANAVAQMLEEGLAIAPVAYHTSAFSTDLYYTTETNARATYYGINSYPTLKADGVLNHSGGGNASQSNYTSYKSIYNQRINQTSPFTIDLSCEPDASGQWAVHCTVNQVGECSATNLKVMIALTQCNINVSWQGMQGLHHVCRDLIPTQNGTTFTGPTMTIDEVFDLNWPKDDCYITAWVQNNSNPKEVYQAVRLPLAMNLDYDLVMSGVRVSSSTNCSGVVWPTVTVFNSGHETVTSCDLVAFVDDVEVHRETWTGSIPVGGQVDCVMEEFDMGGGEQLTLKVLSPNGHDDGYEGDNFRVMSFEEPSLINGYVKMQLKTDSNPEETTVQVKDMVSGEIVRSFTFDLPKHVYIEEFVLPNASCYRISILDSAGNGLGSGSVFKFEDSTGATLLMGSSSDVFEHELAFEVICDGTLEVSEQGLSETEILPNPSDGNFYLNLGDGSWQVTVFDLSGRVVHQESQFSEGRISLEGCKSGMYFLKANNGAKEIVRKLMVY